MSINMIVFLNDDPPSSPTNPYLAELITWLQIQQLREARRYLEAHPILVQPFMDRYFDSLLKQVAGQPGAEAALHQARRLIHDIHRRAGRIPVSVTAIREAYVNARGGALLDIPPWLEALFGEIYGTVEHPQPTLTATGIVQRLPQAIEECQQDATIAPETIAELQNILGKAYQQSSLPDRAQALALAAHQQALTIYIRERYPRQWALTQRAIGNVYMNRATNQRAEDIEAAIVCFRGVLEVCTFEEFPGDFADLQVMLSKLYEDRRTGEKADNLELSIACLYAALRFYTRATHPLKYGEMLNELGIAYKNRIHGDREQNIEQAITYLKEALDLSRNADLLVQAMVTMNLGNAYARRVTVEQRANHEQAIDYYQQALALLPQEGSVEYRAQIQYNAASHLADMSWLNSAERYEQLIDWYEQAAQYLTLDRNPFIYGKIQDGLGKAYRNRLKGSHHDNVELALAHFANALQAFSPEQYPYDRAMNLQDMGNAYDDRPTDTKDHNREAAIRCYQEALRFIDSASYPREYASILMNLGIVMRSRSGHFSQNQEQALRIFQEALGLLAPTTEPGLWGAAQFNLGNLYMARHTGAEEENMEAAITCYRYALSAITPATDPRTYATIQLNLGQAYRNRVHGKERENIDTAMGCFQQALQLRTLADMPLQHCTTQLLIAETIVRWFALPAKQSANQATYRAALQQAHEAFVAARRAMIELGWQESDPFARMKLRGENELIRDMYALDAWCLWQLGDLEGAVVALEEGRAQTMFEAMAAVGREFEGAQRTIHHRPPATARCASDRRCRGYACGTRSIQPGPKHDPGALPPRFPAG